MSALILKQASKIDRLKECLASRKMSIESSRSDARLPGNIVQADVCTRSGKSLLCNFQNAFAVVLCIGAGLTRSGL
jgi:hypothetical protein